METITDQLAASIAAAASEELNSALDRIKHCLGQVTEEQVWWRESEAMNSIGNLLLHLCGNVRQWVIAGIGDEKDVRDRPKEFSERGPIPKVELLRRLEETVAQAQKTLAKASVSELLRRRVIQNNDVTGLVALFHSVTHFRGHTQEIIHMTRSLLAERYKFA